MTDRDALLAAVVADPDNPVPRLVFADYLDEAGDPDWAELIRLQNGYFKHWTNLEEMREREAELVGHVMGRYPTAEGFELGPPVRGFPERVSFAGGGDTTFPEWSDVLRRYPLTWFDLRGGCPLWLGLTDWLTRAVVVDVSTIGPDRLDAISFLVGSTHADRFRALIWREAGLTGIDAETFVTRRPELRGLRELHLADNEIDSIGCDALIYSPHLNNLEYLDLRGNPVGAAAPR